MQNDQKKIEEDLDTSDHIIPTSNIISDGLEDEKQFAEGIASPAILGEESPSGDATNSEPMDIDAAMNEAGIDPIRDRGN